MLSDLKGIQTKIRKAVDLVRAPAPSRMERMAEIHGELADVCTEVDAFTKALAGRLTSDESADDEWHEDSIKVALHDLDKLQDEVNALAGQPPALIIAQNTDEREMRRKMLLPATTQQRFFQSVAVVLNHVKDDLDSAEVHHMAARRKAHQEGGGGPPQDGTRTEAVDPRTLDERGQPRPQPAPTNTREPQATPTRTRDKAPPTGNPPGVTPATPREADNQGHPNTHR